MREKVLAYLRLISSFYYGLKPSIFKRLSGCRIEPSISRAIVNGTPFGKGGLYESESLWGRLQLPRSFRRWQARFLRAFKRISEVWMNPVLAKGHLESLTHRQDQLN